MKYISMYNVLILFVLSASCYTFSWNAGDVALLSKENFPAETKQNNLILKFMKLW